MQLPNPEHILFPDLKRERAGHQVKSTLLRVIELYTKSTIDSSALIGAAKSLSYYELLGVTAEFTLDELRKSHIRMLRTFHPDRAQLSMSLEICEELSLRINTAFETLRDPDRRAAYDNRQRANATRVSPEVMELLRYASNLAYSDVKSSTPTEVEPPRILIPKLELEAINRASRPELAKMLAEVDKAEMEWESLVSDFISVGERITELETELSKMEFTREAHAIKVFGEDIPDLLDFYHKSRKYFEVPPSLYPNLNLIPEWTKDDERQYSAICTRWCDLDETYESTRTLLEDSEPEFKFMRFMAKRLRERISKLGPPPR